MTAKTDLDQMITDFQEKWEGNKIDLMKAVVVLEASRTVLQTVLQTTPTTNQAIEFCKVILDCSLN
jgi:transcription termination factor NusB